MTLYREFRVRARNQLMIFLYHGVVRSPLKVQDWCFLDETSFRSQVKYVKEHFDVIPLSEAVERLRNGRIHRPTAVITFDDGLQNNYDVAFPILREEGLAATIFLVTGIVNSDDTIWYCRLNRALAETKKTSLEWNGSRFDLSGSIPKAIASLTIQARLKEFPHPQLLGELRKIILALDDDPDHPIEVGSPFRILRHEAIKEMAASGLIEFGGHTCSHTILSLLSSKERYDEIVRSITATRELTGRPCELFAYPNGRAQDYDVEVIEILESCSIRAAVTAIEGLNNGITPVMELRRYGIGSSLSMDEFKCEVHRIVHG